MGTFCSPRPKGLGVLLWSREKGSLISYRNLSEKLGQSVQKYLLTFVDLTCHFLTLCQHYIQDYRPLSHLILTLPEKWVIILTVFLPTRKLRH